MMVAAILGAVAIWRFYTLKRVGEASLVISKKRWQFDETIEGIVELDLDDPIGVVSVGLVRIRTDLPDHRSPPFRWWPESSP
jgi:hypothetical protein